MKITKAMWLEFQRKRRKEYNTEEIFSYSGHNFRKIKNKKCRVVIFRKYPNLSMINIK